MVTSTYPIIHASAAAHVPITSGVYALENAITGAIYIGCAKVLQNRYKQWHAMRRCSAVRLRRQCSPRVADALLNAPPEGWRFVVLVTSEGMTHEEMHRLETHAIERAVRSKGELCLNAEYGDRGMRYS